MQVMPFDAQPRVWVFSDGAARGNPGPAGWGAIVAAIDGPSGQVIELGGAADHATNNQMELAGAIAGLRQARHYDWPVTICSDSTYVISGITSWIHGWRRRDWRTAAGEPVANQSHWERLDQAARALKRGVQWRYVPGHRGIPANERVDTIACAFADHVPIQLYDGPLVGYDVAIFDLPEETTHPAPPQPRRTERPSAPFCYLSLVGGVLERHPTWYACEARIKGVSGARFRKAMTEAEAREIARSWGHSSLP